MCPMPLRALPLRCFITASQKPVDDSDSLANGGGGGGRRRAAAGGAQNGLAHSHGASAREKGSKVGAFNGSSAEVAEKKVRGNGQGKAISRVGMQRAQRVRAEGDRKGGRTAVGGRNGRAHSQGASARGKGNKVRHALREMC